MNVGFAESSIGSSPSVLVLVDEGNPQQLVEETTTTVESPETQPIKRDEYSTRSNLLTKIVSQPLDPKEILKKFTRTPNDTNDPSYTNLTIPYSVVCRQRYRRASREQKEKFIKEIRKHERLQVKALDGVRIHREFCNPIISPVSPEQLITLTVSQKRRLERLLRE